MIDAKTTLKPSPISKRVVTSGIAIVAVMTVMLQ